MRKKSIKMKNLKFGYKTIFILILLIAVSLFGIAVSADTNEDLVDQYAPIFYFEGGETCYPVDISYHFSNSYLYNVTETDPEFITELKSTNPLSSAITRSVNRWPRLGQAVGSRRHRSRRRRLPGHH